MSETSLKESVCINWVDPWVEEIRLLYGPGVNKRMFFNVDAIEGRHGRKEDREKYTAILEGKIKDFPFGEIFSSEKGFPWFIIGLNDDFFLEEGHLGRKDVVDIKLFVEVPVTFNSKHPELEMMPHVGVSPKDNLGFVSFKWNDQEFYLLTSGDNRWKFV